MNLHAKLAPLSPRRQIELPVNLVGGDRLTITGDQARAYVDVTITIPNNAVVTGIIVQHPARWDR